MTDDEVYVLRQTLRERNNVVPASYGRGMDNDTTINDLRTELRDSLKQSRAIADLVQSRINRLELEVTDLETEVRVWRRAVTRTEHDPAHLANAVKEMIDTLDLVGAVDGGVFLPYLREVHEVLSALPVATNKESK